MEYKLTEFIKNFPENVILREDLTSLGSSRQISRALLTLVKQGKLAKIGYGVYTKLKYSALADTTYLPQGFVSIARIALTRMGIKWDISEAEKAYNEGRSQQVPANPATKLLTRFRRKLSYKGMELRYE